MKSLFFSLFTIGLGISIGTNIFPIPAPINYSQSFIVQAQTPIDSAIFDQLTGQWDVKMARYGDTIEESPREDIFFTIIGDNLVGVFNETTLLNLNLTEQGTGEFITFNFPQKMPLIVPLISEFSPNYQELKIQVKLTDIDLNELNLPPEELATVEPIFSGDIYLTLEKTTPQKLAQNEARSSLGLIARGLQIYYLEKNQFTDDLDLFAMGFNRETPFYSFAINIINPEVVQLTAIPKTEGLNSYLVGVFVVPEFDFKTKYIICETENSTLTEGILPTLENGQPSCPANFKVIDY